MRKKTSKVLYMIGFAVIVLSVMYKIYSLGLSVKDFSISNINKIQKIEVQKQSYEQIKDTDFDYWDYYKNSIGRDEKIVLNQEDKKKFNTSVDNVLCQASQLDTKYEQELFVHDWIINNTVYDVDGVNKSNGNLYDMRGEDFSASGVFVDGLAVCQGYALAFKYILDMLEIDNELLSGKSKEMSHIWNAVELDGDWYHVDVTWDDPVTDNGTNNINYDYFNVTDEVIQKDHVIESEWKHTANSTKYNFYMNQNNYFNIDSLGKYYNYLNNKMAEKAQVIEMVVNIPTGNAESYIDFLCDNSKVTGKYKSYTTNCSYSDYYVSVVWNINY